MRLRNIPGADEAILNSEYCIKEPESKKGNWQSVFSSTQPLHIEIGMGKGRFIMDMAAAHPDINYLGIERYCTFTCASENGRNSYAKLKIHLHGRR